jgi:hypothetical protein
MLQIVMTLKVSFMLLESSIMLLKNIHSIGVTYVNRHIFIVQANGLSCDHYCITEFKLTRCYPYFLFAKMLRWPNHFAPNIQTSCSRFKASTSPSRRTGTTFCCKRWTPARSMPSSSVMPEKSLKIWKIW